PRGCGKFTWLWVRPLVSGARERPSPGGEMPPQRAETWCPCYPEQGAGNTSSRRPLWEVYDHIPEEAHCQ
ncbi:unnamed protein product, partial [Discosporangium mesarthrocarpum]